MTNKNVYAVKNDKGEYLTFSEDGNIIWVEGAGIFDSNKAFATHLAETCNAHVVTFTEVES